MKAAVAQTSSDDRRSRVLADIASGRLEALGPQEVLTWAVENFHPRLSLSCSFGAPEGMVILDMLSRIEPGFRVFTLDTGRIPQATYDLMDVRDRDTTIECVFPLGDVSRWCARTG